MHAADTTTTSRRAALPSWAYWALAVVRVGVGLYWLWEQHWKLPPSFGRDQPRGLLYALRQAAEHPTFGFIGTIVRKVAIPHFTLFGWLLFLLEVAIGISLVFGLLKRAGAVLGTLHAGDLLLAMAGTPEGPAIYLAILAANAFVLLTPSDRRLSLDRRVLAPRLRPAAERGNRLARLLLQLMGR
ncbi:MAG TPA: hypothetical protein VFI42_17260 [Thermomicrobiaceae bacterium]|nr:hypothetical protein [Thermomicrobiaceae bacterium]